MMVTFLRACPSSEDRLSRVSPVVLKSHHNFAFLGTDGLGTSLPPCSKLLAKYVCCRAVADALPPCFKEKCNVEKSSITVPVSDVF